MDVRTTNALLYLDGVSVSFDGFRALNKLSLAVEPGEMRAIIGPNGAGKTTMMDVVTGRTRPDVGGTTMSPAIAPSSWRPWATVSASSKTSTSKTCARDTSWRTMGWW